MTASAVKVPVVVVDPMEALNAMITAKRAEARQRDDANRRALDAHCRTEPCVPADCSPAEEAATRTSWNARRDSLRRAIANFRESLVMAELDDEPSSKQALKRAVDYLRVKVDEVQRQPAPVAPKVEDRHVLQPADELPPLPIPAAHRVPSGGLFGTPDAKPLADDLAELEREVKAFPERIPFVRVVEMVNSLNARLYRATPPPMPKRMDKGYVPRHG